MAVLVSQLIAENESHCHKVIKKIVHFMSCSNGSLTNSMKSESEVLDGFPVATLCEVSFLCDGAFDTVNFGGKMCCY